MTLREWLETGTAQLRFGPHADRARPDAEMLLRHVLGKDRAWLIGHADDDIAESAAIRYTNILDRRKKGEPVQYITGHAEFYGLPFRVTPAILIPRPETEHLVEEVLLLAASLAQPRIVDIGTGSGAIAIALAHKLPQAQITAIDISESALSIARENAEHNSVADRIRFLHGDLLAPADMQFDIVASNPPYVPASDRPSLAVEVRDHEPASALFPGPNSLDGLDIYRRLIPAAFTALVPGGFIALEIGYGQADPIRALLSDAGFADINYTPDLQGISRVATARHP